MALQSCFDVMSVAISPDNSKVATGQAECINVWDVEHGQTCTLRHYCTFPGRYPVSIVEFSPDGSLLAAAVAAASVAVWHVASRTNILYLTSHRDLVSAVAFSADSACIASGSQDGSIALWDMAPTVPTGAGGAACRCKLYGHTMVVLSLAFSVDGRYLASGSGDASIKIWDTDKGVCTRTLLGHDNAVSSLLFLPTGPLLSSAWSAGTMMWNVATGARRRKLPNILPSPVWAAVLSPDGAWVVAGIGGDTLYIWDVASRKCLCRVQEEQVQAAAFSRDRKYLVFCAGQSVMIAVM